jgi:hypothetical protein
MIKTMFTSFFLILFVPSCTSLSPHQKHSILNVTDCEKLSALINSANTGFAQLKGAKVNTSFLTSWNAKAHLIGDECMITKYNSNKLSYHCERQFDEINHANNILNKAKTKMNSCLTSDWTKTKINNGVSFQNIQNKIAINLQLSETLSKSQPYQIKLDVKN